MKILMLNFADSGPLGETGFTSLRKAGNIVLLINFFQNFTFRDGQSDHGKQLKVFLENDIVSSLSKNSIIFNVMDYDQIIICAHGKLNDTEYCYYEDFKSDSFIPLFTPTELAKFLKKFIVGHTLPNNVVLCMCYGARTINFLEYHAINDINSFSRINVKQSFAYELASSLSHLGFVSCQNEFVLSAFMGAVKFDDRNGAILVETEVQIYDTLFMIIQRVKENSVFLEIQAIEKKYI